MFSLELQGRRPYGVGDSRAWRWQSWVAVTGELVPSHGLGVG